MSTERPRPGRLVLIGHPVAHSLSPRFQNAALRAAGIGLEYSTWDVAPDDLERTLGRLRDERAAGNVTVPHKERVALYCDRVTSLADAVGAVNVFWVERDAASGRLLLVGDNTDVEGAARALERLAQGPVTGCRVLLLGAGGAAAAVLAALSRWSGNQVLVRNRDRARAERLVARFGAAAQCSDDARDAESADIVVNATSLGLHADDPLPCEVSRLRPDARVLDVVYRQGGTPWVRAARARGLAAEDGTIMLVEQGAAAFERWFGITPDRRVMWKSLAD